MRKHAEKKNGLHDLMEIMLESMMVAASFWLKIRAIRVTDIDPGIVMVKGKSLSSAFRATVTVTSIRRFWPSCATRRRNVTDWPEYFIPKDLHRNRSAMYSNFCHVLKQLL